MFLKSLKVELNRAFKNKWFLIAIFVGLALASVSAVSQIDRYVQYTTLNFNPDKYYPPHLYNCFGMWMSVEYVSPTSLVFYRLAPLLATLPCAWSLGEDYRTGYANQCAARASRGCYLLSKLAAAFIVGGVVVVLPQLVNFVAIACFVPAFTPDVTDAMYVGIFHDNLLSELFYGAPWLYVLAYLTLDFVLVGLWAILVSCVSYFARNRVLSLALPYLFLAIVQVVNERIFVALGGIKGMQLSLFENLRAATSMYVQSWDVIVAEALVLAAVVAISFVVMRRRDLL